MLSFSSKNFEIYKRKTEAYLRNPDPDKLPALFEELKAASFMGEISDSESEYLINLLPIEGAQGVDVFDDEDMISRNTGGIKMNDFDMSLPKRGVPDELDDFDFEEEQKESGFGGLFKRATSTKGSPIDDEFDDFEDDDDDAGSTSGFLGLFK